MFNCYIVKLLIMKTLQKFITDSFAETQRIAEEFAKTLKGGEVLCLHGDLGYGKTTFIQGLAKGLGIAGNIVSPTFIIMRSYNVIIKNQKSNTKNTDKKLKMFFHVDLYRINHEREIMDLGVMDFINNSENIVAIEWPEKMGILSPRKRIDIVFEYIDEDKRKITITKNSEVS